MNFVWVFTEGSAVLLQSVQIGKVITEGDPGSKAITDRLWTSAFRKEPIHSRVQLTSTGIVGDEVANTKHHGGVDKAVLCYAAEHYATWKTQYPELTEVSGRGNFGCGAFAENLTIVGQNESNVCIGDRYTLGEAEIEISQPRQPCWKIARRWAMEQLPKEVGRNGRTGWYARVTRGGEVGQGDELSLVIRPNPGWTVARANDVLMGREVDRMAVIELMNLPQLADAWKKAIA